MKLAELQSHRPAEGADSAALAAAIAVVEQERAEQARRQVEAEGVRRNVLNADERTLTAAERDGNGARLIVDAADAILAELRPAHAAAAGREVVADLREDMGALEPLAERLRRWQRDDYPQIARLIHEGLTAQHELAAAQQAFKERVVAAYARPEVQAVGELGRDLPSTGAPIPSIVFFHWQRGEP